MGIVWVLVEGAYVERDAGAAVDFGGVRARTRSLQGGSKRTSLKKEESEYDASDVA